MLVVRNIFKRYGSLKVLLGVSFALSRGQKIALVGPNGVGKSTLLRILAGVESEDRGKIEKSKGIRVAALPQEVILASEDDTVLGLLRDLSGIAELEARMRKLEATLDDEKSLEAYGDLRDLYERLGGFSFPRKARLALDGLGLRRIPLEREISTISSGERRRVAIAGTLLREADLLLLDEPTNDLDLPSILWLESFLRDTDAAVIVASHDRAFLDAVAEKVLEIDWHFRTGRMWTGNYSTYFREKSEMLRQEREEHERAETERGRLRDTALEKKEWARIGGEQIMPDRDKMSQGYHRDRAERKFGAAAKALENRAEQVKRIALHAERDPLEIYFEPAEGEGRSISVVGASAGYGAGFSVGPVNMEIPYGARVGIFGRNGAGKSTLLKMITGELPLSGGGVTRGESVRIGSLSQVLAMLPLKKSAVKWITSSTEIVDEADALRFLVRFLLDAPSVTSPLEDLSPGERMRVGFAFLMASRVNVLVLDEPTNHLDVEAVTALETALDLYKGTLLLVSHDRAFLSRVVFSQVWSVEEGVVSQEKEYPSYLERAMKAAEEEKNTFRRVSL